MPGQNLPRHAFPQGRALESRREHDSRVAPRAPCIGVISDTHGYFDPALPDLFRGVEQILHGGDICGVEVVQRLEQIAAVTSIVGNCDRPPLTDELPEWRCETLHGVRVLIVHDLGRPERPRPTAKALLSDVRPDIVVSGHSHQGRVQVHEGILFVNPGSAGKKRFRLPRTVARLSFGARAIEATLLSLEGEVGAVLARCAISRGAAR